VRPSRRADQPQAFVSALQEKYGSGGLSADQAGAAGESSPAQIEISGKVVEEVGFEKIRRRLAQLQELRIVILDGMRIGDAGAAGDGLSVRQTCPRVTELDLSRNLFTDFGTVVSICAELAELRTLRLKYVLSSHRPASWCQARLC
jgi:hypothetical protein